MVGVLEIAARGAGARAARRPGPRAAARSRPRRRRSRGPRRRVRSARPRRASPRPEPRGRRNPARRRRRRWWSRRRRTRRRRRLAPWRHPRRSEAGAGRRDGAATAAGRTGSAARYRVRGACDEPTPRRSADSSPRDNAAMLDAHASSALVDRVSERAALDQLVAGVRAGREPGAGPPRRGGSRQDRAAAAPVGARGRMPDRSRGGRRVRDGARVRRPARAVRAHARPPRSPPEPAARRAEHGVRPERRPATGSLPRRAGGPEPAGRRRRGAAARVHRRRRAVARPRVGADARVRGAPASWPSGSGWCSRCASPATGTRSRGCPELVIEGLAAEEAQLLLNATIPGPLDERVKAQILAETRGNPLALIELPRGLTPAELAGGFGLLEAPPLGEPHRADLPQAGPGAAARHAAAAPDGGGRAAGRFALVVASRRTARHRRRRRAAGGGRRVDRARIARALLAPARPLGGLPGRGPR